MLRYVLQYGSGKISITIDVQIEEFKSWLEKEAVNILQPLNDQGKKLVSKVKERLSDAREMCEKLAEEGNKEVERGKAVRKAKVTEKLSRYFLKQIDKVGSPDKMSFGELSKLHDDLEKMLSSVAKERNAWFPRISPLFIITRKRVDFAFSRLAGSISELSTFLSGDYSKARTVEELLNRGDELSRLVDNLSKCEERKASLREKIQFFERKIEENQKNIQTIEKNAELGSLSEVNQKIQQLRKQVKYDLRHLEKPFMKFANVVDSPSFALTSEEVKKLREYLEDPFVGLATEEPSYPVLKSLLRKIKQTMDEGKLRLKSSRLRKAREKIDEVLNQNTLDELYSNCVHVFSTSQQLVSSEDMRIAQRKLKRLEERFGQLLRRRKAVAVRLDALRKECEQFLEKFKVHRGELEESVFEFLGKRVSIKL